MFVTIETNKHLFIPLAYNRLLKRRKVRVPVHGAGIESEIHRTASEFPLQYLTIPNIYSVVDTHSYIMDNIFTADSTPKCVAGHTHSREISNELIDLANYLIGEGYFPYGFTVLLTNPKPIVFDFSMCGIIDKGTVRFPNKEGNDYYEKLVSERRLFHYVIGYDGTLSEKIESELNPEEKSEN